MKAVIVNFRGGQRTQKTNQFLLEVDGINSRALASKLIGKKVTWKSPSRKEISGKIANVHGNNGVVRARFTKGLPGTALGKSVTIKD